MLGHKALGTWCFTESSYFKQRFRQFPLVARFQDIECYQKRISTTLSLFTAIADATSVAYIFTNYVSNFAQI